MKKIALIEFGDSHDEVLYPQYRFLKDAGQEVIIVVSEALADRLFEYPQEDLHYFTAKPRIKDFRKLHRQLQKWGVEKVVINTASGKKVRNFLWSKPWSKLDYYGILHNLRKLEGSFTQKLISRKLKKYFLLADYLAEEAQKLQASLHYSSFYAAFLPQKQNLESLQKPENEIWVLIPGQVEYKRRDYLGLLNSLEGRELPAGLRFILLGKSRHAFGDGAALEIEIAARDLGAHFKLWERFVPNSSFYAYLQKADFVLPLIHPDHQSGALYQKQISGAWNMAFAYQCPLLMEESWRKKKEFSDAAHFYSISKMSALWTQLGQIQTRSFYQKDKWSFSQQAQRYLHFLQIGKD